jgi:hypothetical protein
MPLPLAPLLPLALRIGAVAGAGYAAARWVNARRFPGRTDQRAEDALDDLGEGISLHRPADRAQNARTDAQTDAQTNATARMRRTLRIGRRSWELDAGVIARFRIRQREA